MLFRSLMAKEGLQADEELLREVIPLVKERAVFARDILSEGRFFFVRPEDYDPQVVKKRWKEGTGDVMMALAEFLREQRSFTSTHLERGVKSWAEAQGHSIGYILNALRLSLVGTSAGPGVFDIMQVLGKEESLLRIERAVKALE